ncbi:nesprin-1 [Caerostris darwini]|uniref:Nesprin-1 n=1 Tax=Caerostris darwini TaxID=1538125 RepID=A0AAV4SFZ5_9ARAC|nr:nesprin-1 [Caerostris darwini]
MTLAVVVDVHRWHGHEFRAENTISGSSRTSDERIKKMCAVVGEKEKLLHVKTNLMSYIPLLYQLVPLQSTFDKGYTDINLWLNEAEKLISSYGIPSSAQAISVLQDKHKAFFACAPAYKSQLESVKNVYRNIMEHASGIPNVDVHEVQIKVSNLNARLESCLSLANQWENAMAEAADRWARYNKSLKIVKEKLQAAEGLLEKKPTDAKQLESHKEFFSQLNDSIIKDLFASSEAVLATLPAAEQTPVRETVMGLQERWNNMIERIPFHLRVQEFRLKETEFSHQLHEMKRELNAEQQMIDSGDSSESILKRHKEFFTAIRIGHVKDNLDFLKTLSNEYKISPSKDINLKESYVKHQKEWLEVEKQIEGILSQLQKLRADWKEYCERFNDLLNWMDEVEKNIQCITKDITSSQEFETMKTKFLSVCQTVDSRREDVKWLVRKLDSLMSHIPKEEATEEQRKLDVLLQRYKSLLPEIDTTIVITETITKCFTYREEITEVNRWLREVRALTEQVEETSYDDPEKLSELVQQQEAIVQQLETHLGNVKSSVQKGKELGKLQRSPKFVEKDVTELEKTWEEVYQKATTKLITLKNASHLWNDYDKQKDEIFRLLKQADDELKKLRESAKLQQPPKQYKELHQTTETHLEKLKSVGSNLAPKLSERQRPLLQKEVVEIENKVLMVLSTLKENVEYLERSTEKWTKFNFKLEGFVSNVDNVIDRLKEILSESSPPEVRLKKLDELHSEIREQKQVLVNLETESQELATDQPDSANVKQIIGQLTNLKGRLHTLEETVITQRNIIAKNLDEIKNVKDILKSERDELKAAELKVEAGLPALASLKDARDKKQDSEKFCDHCHQKINYLADVGTQTTKELSDASIQCEFIQLQDQWREIAQTIQGWIEQLQAVITLWEGISIKQEEVIKWLEITEETVETITSTQTTLSSEIDEKRNYLRTITKDIEDLSGHLSPKAVMALHVQTSDIQKRIDDLGDRIRRHLIHLGSSIAEQEQLLKTIDTFTHWEEDVKIQLHKFDDIFVDQIEAVLKNIELLRTENDSRRSDFNGIYEEVKKLSDSHDTSEIEEITAMYSKLSELYQNTEELLSRKQKFLQKRLDFESWYKDMHENIDLLKSKVEGKKYTSDELQTATDELTNLQKEYEKKVNEVENLDEMAQKVNQVIRDRSTTLPVSVGDRLAHIERLLKTVRDLLTLEQEGLSNLNKKWDEFNSKYEALCRWLSNVNNKMIDLDQQSSTFADFEQQLHVLKELHKEMEDQQAAYSIVHQLGRSLIEEDSSSFTTIQGYLTATDKQWEQVSTDISQKEKSIGHLLQLWKECNSLQGKLQSATNNAAQAVKPPSHVSTDSIQITKLLEKAKGGNEILKSHHYELDTYIQKSQDLCEKLSSYNVQDLSKLKDNYSNVRTKWQGTWKEVESRLQNLESQMVLWQQIDYEKEEIIAWTLEIGHCLGEEIDNFESREKADLILDRYKSELTTHLEMKKDLLSKIESLRNLNNNAEISTLTALKTVIETHFNEAEDLARKLQACISDLGVEEEDIRKEQQELSDWLRVMRENISKCEDVSADDEAILLNHENCKQLEAEISAYKDRFEKLDAKVAQTKQKHSKLDTSYVEKENSNLQKRYEKVKGTASKIANFLSSSVERRYQIALQDYQRWMLTNTEKLSSCKPDLVGDRYSLEAKLGLLQEIESNLVQGENKKTKLEVTAANIIQVLPPERHPEVQSVVDQCGSEWGSFISSIDTIKSSLLKNLSSWQKYEIEYENFSSWLRDMESKVKSVTAQQVELNDIQQQLSVVKNLQGEVNLKKKNLDDLLSIIQEICAENPEARLKTQTSEVTSRYQALERTLQETLRRLENLLKVKKEYETSKVTLQNWLQEMDKQLESNFDVSGDKEALQSKLQSLKDLLSKKEQNTPILSSVTDAGELIYLSLSMEGRDQIRKEMRCLRDSWDEKWEKVSTTIKNIESALMAWGTFEESCKQVGVWLNELSGQMGSEVQLKPTLAEKKLQLQSFKAVAQGILAYQTVITKLKDKASTLPESAPKHNVESFQAQYDSLISSAKDRVQICDQHVVEHEKYAVKLEHFQDWLSSLKAAVDTNVDQGDTESLKVKIIALSTVLSTLEEGKQKLDDLEKLLGEVLQHTDQRGHSVLKSELNDVREQWKNFLNQCQHAHDTLSNAVEDRGNCEADVAGLEEWLAKKEHLVREQALRSSLETKQAQLQNVKNMEGEILAKQPDISSLSAKTEQLRGDTALIARMSRILNKYQNLKNAAKDSVRKWELYVKEHEYFEKKLAEVLKWLEEPEKKLQENSVLFGDMLVLQERKAALETLSDQLSQNLYHIETTIELGEKLYSSTSPEGREIIRQKIKNLQKQWEALQEKCNGTLRSVDSCLQKLISFSQGQDRLSKWLQEVGLSVQQHTEPKSTIQEKRAQLQSQKVIHQDILSHKPLLEAVCDKANELMSVTGDNTIPSYIQDVKMMYNAMCTKSEGLLGKLKDSINDHQKYLDNCRKFQEFLSTCHIKLQECKDTSGEKAIITSRLSILKDLMSKQSEGDKMLSDLEKLCAVVCKNTSEHGCEILKHEMKELSDSWSQYNTALMESKCNLTNVIQQWNSFEKNMQALNKWFKDIDTEFKKPQLQSTLEEKEGQFNIIKDLNEKVMCCQKDLDTLTDEAHSLTHSSGVESIKFDVSQLNVRYQNLVSLSKTLLHRWEIIVQDHKAYEAKADEFSEWLASGQKILAEIETEESIEQSMIKLQVLVNDKLQGQQLLSETVQSGERLYQDTATAGRESIRERLRELRDKFDLFSNSVLEVQRQLDSLNQHWISFKDTFKQILNWMDATDRTLSSHDLNLPSLQDINSRLLKYKALNQETEPHKRQLDLLQSKVQSVAPLMKEEDLPLSILEATARFNNIVFVIKDHLEKIEHLSNLYQQCQDQKDVCEDWCQKNEEQLILCSDFAGNRTVLKAKEEQLRNLKEHLPEGIEKIQLYGKHVQQLSGAIAARDFEQLVKRHAAFEKRYQDIATNADETLREMTEKFKQWETFDEKCNVMTSWLENMEQRIKDFVLKTTLEEKIEQRDKFQVIFFFEFLFENLHD